MPPLSRTWPRASFAGVFGSRQFSSYGMLIAPGMCPPRIARTSSPVYSLRLRTSTICTSAPERPTATICSVLTTISGLGFRRSAAGGSEVGVVPSSRPAASDDRPGAHDHLRPRVQAQRGRRQRGRRRAELPARGGPAVDAVVEDLHVVGAEVAQREAPEIGLRRTSFSVDDDLARRVD